MLKSRWNEIWFIGILAGMVSGIFSLLYFFLRDRNEEDIEVDYAYGDSLYQDSDQIKGIILYKELSSDDSEEEIEEGESEEDPDFSPHSTMVH